jgi:glyceraldehyde 3-phosphate dehydrogenase
MKKKIAINGLGRIGRCVLRAFFEYGFDKDFDLVAINAPADISQHVHLIKYDSVHGFFNGTVEAIGENILSVNSYKIPLIQERDPNKINWSLYGVDIVFECTGVFTSKDKASIHIKQGAKRVMISAPAKEKDIKTIVYGVNNLELTSGDQIVSVGSCTTNCLAPIAKVLHDNLGIVKGFMTTIHSYTSDQNILDGSHSKGDMRRARSAALSMVPTSTGAAKAIGLVIPELEGKLDGSSIRVPTPNVSVVDLCFESLKQTSKQEINDLLIKTSQNSMKGVLFCESSPLVSTDFNHNPHSSIVDLLETKVVGGNFVRVLSWYDNEWAFSVRMLDVAKIW